MYRLLIADDEAIIRNGLVEAIEWMKLGFEVVGVAEDGLETLRMVRATKADVLLTDIRMPGLDGLRVLRELKEERPELEVVIITGYADFTYAKEALKHHAFDYVIKTDMLTELEPVFVRLRDHLTDVRERHERTPLHEMFAHGDSSSVVFEGNFMLPCIARGSDDSVRRALEGRLPRHRWVKFRDGCWGIIVSCELREELDAETEKLAASLAYAGASLIIGGSAVDVMTLDISARFTLKAFDLVRIHPQLDGGRVSVEALPWSSGSVNQSAHVCAIAQAMIQGDWEGFRTRVDIFTREMITSNDATIYELRLGLIDALSRAVAAHPGRLGAIFSSCVQALLKAASMLEAAEELTRRADELKQSSRVPTMIGDADIQKAVLFISAHFMENLRLEDIAKRHYMSAAHFSRRFKRATGIGFWEYVRNFRLAWAKNLIEQTDMRIIDVAREAGYADVKHFARLFLDTYRVTPSQMRKNASM